MKGRDQPEWELVMGDYDEALGIKQPLAEVVKGVSSAIDTLFPADPLREWARGRIQKTALRLGRFGDPRRYPVRLAAVNEALSLDHLRSSKRAADPKVDAGQDALREAAEQLEQVEPLVFDPSPEKSFLPHMVALSREHGFKLHFHRIKINPSIWPTGTKSEVTLPSYLEALQEYLSDNGCLYSDESVEHAITVPMYVDDVHIKSDQATQQSYMKVFWRHVQPFIGGIMQTAGAPEQNRTAS
ncbi:MAG: hypothetical protein ACOYMN_19065 [Roseimicrobium sp.]